MANKPGVANSVTGKSDWQTSVASAGIHLDLAIVAQIAFASATTVPAVGSPGSSTFSPELQDWCPVIRSVCF